MRYKLPDSAFQRLAALLVICFVLVAAGASWWGVVAAEDLYQEDSCRRIERDLGVDRGRILAADGSAIAYTEMRTEGNTIRCYPYSETPRYPYAVRRYAYAPLSPVVGYWSLQYGTGGLEQAYDEYLSGRRGFVGLDAFDEVRHETVVGADIVTTIRPALQRRADDLLGGQRGAVVILDPGTGDVLAMASHPYYDPNTYDEFGEQIVTDPARPNLNRATAELYTPGSVFKVVTLTGALAQGVASLDTQFTNNGFLEVNGFAIRDASNQAQSRSPYDLRTALAWSSNITFAEIGLQLGPDGLRTTGEAMGFGQEIPFPLPTVASSLGRDDFLLDQVGLANTAYGQGQLQVSPLHMALITASIANEGVMMTPRLVSEIRSRDGQTVQTFEPTPWLSAMSNGVAADVREAMIFSASDGYARAGAPEGIAIGGKTGTAQLGGPQEPHAWFIAFAPADDPQIAIAVIVENSGLGGDVAAPIARELIQAALSAAQ